MCAYLFVWVTGCVLADFSLAGEGELYEISLQTAIRGAVAWTAGKEFRDI